jgi:signal transduction histidine kinase
VFSSARWRLTLWFGGAVAVIIVLLGFVVYLVAQRLLMDGVEDDLRARAERETRPLVSRIQQSQQQGQPVRDLTLGPAFTAGGYFYALMSGGGDVIASTTNADPSGLATVGQVTEALEEGARFVDAESSDGQELRLYLVPLRGAQVSQFVLEVGRSIEPELEALRRLLFVFAVGGGVAILLAATGGYFLAGRALAPISRAVDRQRAFVADASHELRTPLALIRANAELLRTFESW